MNMRDMKSSPPLVVAGAVALASSVWMYRSQQSRRRRRRRRREERLEGMQSVRLSPTELSFAMFQSVQGISTLTWYEGNAERVSDQLRKKASEICRANLWLAGKLVTAGKSQVSLVWPPSFDEGSSVFRVLGTDAGISRDTPFQELPNRLDRLGVLVRRGIDLVDRDDGSVFRVSLLPDSDRPTERFALVVSLAHCVGDGYTFYELHNMLSDEERVRAMDPARKNDLADDIATSLGGRDQAASLAEPPPGFIVRFLKGAILSSLFGPPTKVELFWIDEGWIRSEKDRVASDEGRSASVSYVSSNDVVTARFFRLCGTDQGIMSINFRGKIPGCDPDMAGNYFNYLVCRPTEGDCDSPAWIRSAVREICAGAREPTSSPLTSWGHVRSDRLFAATSNWTTFCKPVHLAGCRQDVHVPVIPCDSKSAPARFVTGLFIFRPGGGAAATAGGNKIAAMFAGPPAVWETLKRSGMVGPALQ